MPGAVSPGGDRKGNLEGVFVPGPGGGLGQSCQAETGRKILMGHFSLCQAEAWERSTVYMLGGSG